MELVNIIFNVLIGLGIFTFIIVLISFILFKIRKPQLRPTEKSANRNLNQNRVRNQYEQPIEKRKSSYYSIPTIENEHDYNREQNLSDRGYPGNEQNRYNRVGNNEYRHAVDNDENRRHPIGNDEYKYQMVIIEGRKYFIEHDSNIISSTPFLCPYCNNFIEHNSNIISSTPFPCPYCNNKIRYPAVEDH